LPLIVLGAAVVYLYFPVLVALVARWRIDENYSHGFLVPFVSAYVIWERRAQLRECQTKVFAWGYAMLALGLVLLILGQAAIFGFLSRVSLVLVLAGLVLFLEGPAVLRLVAFPLAYLLFMVPLPDQLLNQVTFPLQLLAAKLATTVLDLFNIPVLREGNIIALPTMRLEVAEACSGIRSLISLLALSTVYAHFSQKRWDFRVLLALSAIPIALITNGARVTLTGVLVEKVDPRLALGFYHTFSGLLMFVLAFALLAVEGQILSRVRVRPT
jgi:exosortase A